MRLRPYGGALVVALAGTVLMGSAGFSTATAPPTATKAAALRKTYRSALSPADIARLSASPTERVIVLLANQLRSVPGSTTNVSARAAALTAAQRPIVSELQSLHAPNLHSYSFVNALSATVSHDEAVRLATNPAVSAVVPDATVTGPSSSPTTPATPATKGAAPATPAVVPAPAPGVCPTNPAQPILEPEALQLMNVDFGPGSTQPSASQLADGTGVKVAVFPDGLDPNIADFIRNGTSAIFDYQDFTGEGAGAVTGGVEAFGDATSIIGQGNQVFDLSKEVNAAHALPAGCNIRIKGVAPGADLAVMKVFGDQNSAFNSEILNGLEYAVVHDHVDILSESFGGNPVPNPGTDPIAVFDADAAAAGITVVVSTGDAGTTNTIGTPATNPAVISAAATTSYRLYAQTGSYGYGVPPGSKGWLSNEISAFSSSGDTEYGPNTVDVAAPGESGWADCSTNTAVFTECADLYHGPNPQPIVAFGGTSQSAPLTAGTAALVIQAYRHTHGGVTPAPALVKQIITSSAQDIDARSDLQGAGLVDALRAVQTAESVHDGNGSPTSAGPGLVYSTNSIALTGIPGQPGAVPVTVTNTGNVARTVNPTVRVLGPAATLASGQLQLSPSDPTFIYQTGATVGDVHLVPFTVPAGLDRLVSDISWLTDTQTGTIRASLFDPSGRMAAQSRPQGAGGGFGEDEIHNPTPGQWTLLVFETVPYTGPLQYTITGAKFVNVANSIVPTSRVIPAGGSGTFTVIASTPSKAGDLAESLAFSDPANTGPPLATIPLILRSTVPVYPGLPGSFAGTLTGGNARIPFYGQELVYQFDVPANIRQVNANITVGAPGYQVLAFLADPHQVPADIQSTTSLDGTTNLQTIHLSWHNPIAGRWNLDLTQVNGISSLRTSTPITGTIDFNASQVSATGLPTSATNRLSNGVATNATVHITNTGNSAAAYSIDPRLTTSSQLSLESIVPTTGIALPISDPASIPQFIVPPFSTELEVAAQSTVPITMSTSPDFGTPEVLAGTSGNNAIATLVAPDIPASLWSCGPNEIGPFSSGATATTFSCGAAAVTNAFDPAVDSASGNIWSALEGVTGTYNPLVLQPGQTGTIPVTITPSGASGSVVSGFLAVETFNFGTVSSDQLASLPYTYTIR